MTNLDSIFKSRDIPLPTKVHLVKTMVFPVVMYGCESWTVKKAEHRRIDAFELWCWRKLLFCRFDGVTLSLCGSLLPVQEINTFFSSSCRCCSVAKSCPTLCDPMNCSMPGLPVHHQLPEFTQTHVHQVCDAIQPSHPLSSPSPPAPHPSLHQSLFQ